MLSLYPLLELAVSPDLPALIRRVDPVTGRGGSWRDRAMSGIPTTTLQTVHCTAGRIPRLVLTLRKHSPARINCLHLPRILCISPADCPVSAPGWGGGTSSVHKKLGRSVTYCHIIWLVLTFLPQENLRNTRLIFVSALYNLSSIDERFVQIPENIIINLADAAFRSHCQIIIATYFIFHWSFAGL